ncbi:deoxyribonuclease-2-beta isoform X1 [Sigmodon hispidus]
MMTNPARTALVLLVFALFGLQDTEEITCKNEEGDAVDWFIFYKLPKRLGKEHADSGREYLYLDSTMRTWRKGQHLVNSNRSMLARTLEPLYEANISQSNNTAYLIYNDGVPKSTNYSKKYGHTKGLLVWNRIKGFWLIHSVPRFPQIPEDGYDYPSSGERYGQSGICITFKYNQYEVIDSQLLVLQPNIYSCSIPDVFHWELIHIPNLCNKTSSFTIPSRHITDREVGKTEIEKKEKEEGLQPSVTQFLVPYESSCRQPQKHLIHIQLGR